MVGFIHHDENEENNLPSKLKNPVDSTWCDKFDFLDRFVPEIEDLSLPVNTSLLDFDSIKDWIEEMQDPELEKRSETAPNHGGDVLVEGSSVENACLLEAEQPGGINEELIAVDDSEDCLRKESEGLENSSAGNGEKLSSLNIVVEEGLGKVSLVDEVEFSPVDESCRKENATVSEVLEGDKSSDSDSESESSSDSSSSSSSSSSSGEDDDDDVDEGEKKVVVKEGLCEVEEELEEGEIMETDADKMVCWGNEDDDEDGIKDSFSKGGASEEIFMDDDDEDVVAGPIMSKNELKDLPPVPPVDVTLQPSHQMLPVGVVNSILGAQVIVEGGEKHNPLSEGSILWITEKRSPLGRVDEIFGPVKNPYYIVRYNSESEVPEGLHQGISVSFVPEFVDHILNNKNLYQKGYDASGNNDEEADEAEFSDDEQEAEYKKMLKMSKRGNKTDNTKPGGYKKSNNNSFNRNDTHSNNSIQKKDRPPVQVNNNNMQNQQFEAPIRPPPERSVQPGSSRFSPGFTAGPGNGMRPRFPQQVHRPNGMLFQTQNQEFAGGFQMPWVQQHQNLQPRHPMMNSRPPFQQGFNPAGLTPNNGLPFSPLPVAGGSMVPPNALNQVPLSMALQAQLAQLSMLSGLLLAGQGGGPPPSLPPQSAEAGGPPQFNNQGAAASHQGPPPQFNNQGAAPPHQGGPPQFNNQGAAPPHEGCPPQFNNQGATPPHQGVPPQFNNQGAALPHQGGPSQFNNQGAAPSHQGSPPQFNQGATSSHQGGNRPPFQRRGGGRSRGGGGRRGGGRRPFPSR